MYRDKLSWSDAPKTGFARIKNHGKPDMTIEVMQHHDGDWGYHIFSGQGSSINTVYLYPLTWGFKTREDAQEAGASFWWTSIR